MDRTRNSPRSPLTLSSFYLAQNLILHNKEESVQSLDALNIPNQETSRWAHFRRWGYSLEYPRPVLLPFALPPPR